MNKIYTIEQRRAFNIFIKNFRSCLLKKMQDCTNISLVPKTKIFGLIFFKNIDNREFDENKIFKNVDYILWNNEENKIIQIFDTNKANIISEKKLSKFSQNKKNQFFYNSIDIDLTLFDSYNIIKKKNNYLILNMATKENLYCCQSGYVQILEKIGTLKFKNSVLFKKIIAKTDIFFSYNFKFLSFQKQITNNLLLKIILRKLR